MIVTHFKCSSVNESFWGEGTDQLSYLLSSLSNWLYLLEIIHSLKLPHLSFNVALFLMGSQVANIGQSLYVEFAANTAWREWFSWTGDISSPFSFIMRWMDFMDTLCKRITHLTNSACHAGCVSAGYEMMRLRDPVFKSMNRTLDHVTWLLWIHNTEWRQTEASREPSPLTEHWTMKWRPVLSLFERQVHYRSWTEVNLMTSEWWRTCPWFVKQCRKRNWDAVIR